jgi:hypothetical protein
MNKLGLKNWHYIFFGVALFFALVAKLAYDNNPLLAWGWEGELYWRFYSYISAGQQPFVNFFIEYPPISAYFIALPAIISKSFSQLEYLTSFALITSGLALSVPFILTKTAEKIWHKNSIEKIELKHLQITQSTNTDTASLDDYNERETHNIPNENIGIENYSNYPLEEAINFWNSKYLLLLIPSFTLITTRYDIFPAWLSLVGICIWIVSLRKPSWFWPAVSYTLLAIATFVKIYPILIILVLALLDLWRRKWFNLIILVITILLTAMPTAYFVLNGQDRFQGFVNYQTASRDLQIESIYASVAFGLEKLNIVETSKVIVQNGAMELTNDYAKLVAKVNLYILAIIFILSFLIVLIKLKPWGKINSLKEIKFSIPSQARLINLSVLGSLFAVSTFMLWNKVMSPQYLIWILVLLPLLSIINIDKITMIKVSTNWFIILFLTFLIYPANYSGITNREIASVIILLTRNIFLIWWWIWLLRKMVQSSKII